MAVEQIQLNKIDDNPFNPRKHYKQTEVREMANSLREVGLLQVPEGRRVDGHVQLAYGHVRLRAYRINQEKEPEKWASMPVDVKEITDREMFDKAWEENVRRTDITPIELARCIQSFSEMFPDVLEKDIGAKHGMTEANVSNMKRVLRLPAKFLEKIDEGLITFTQGRELLTLDGLPEAENLMSSALAGLKIGNKVYGEPNTVDGLQKSIHSVISGKYPPIDKTAGGWRFTLLFDAHAAGCFECPKVIRTHPTKSQVSHYCLDEVCWQKKTEEHREKAAAAAKAKMQAEIDKRLAEEAARQPPPPEPEPEKADFSQEKSPPETPAAPTCAICKAGNNWVAKDGDGVIIAIGNTAEEARTEAKNYCEPCPHVLNPSAENYKLNHTYRITAKPGVETHTLPDGQAITDVTADSLPAALKAMDYKPQDVKSVKVWKSSGKLGTAGGASAGWSKCTESMEPAAAPISEEEFAAKANARPWPTAADEEALEERVDQRDRQLEEAREKANLERPVGEIPCETCARDGVSCNRENFCADQESDRYICDTWEPKMAAPAPAAPPEDALHKAKAAAGTRAEVLDLMEITTGEGHWRSYRSGYANLDEEKRYIEDFEECLERCTHGFHYAYDSKHPEEKEFHVCSDPKCLAKKKGAKTRAQNAEGLARKNAERAAVKQVLEQVGEVVDKAGDHIAGIMVVAGLHVRPVPVPRAFLELIIYNQLHGKNVEDYYYSNGWKKSDKWLWDKLSAGTKDEKRNEITLWKLIRKLSDADLVKLITEYLFYYLQDQGDVGRYEIKLTEPLSFFGIERRD